MAHNKRNPSAILTISGKEINPSDIKASDITIEDVARGLSKVCRYAGQRKEFISVAEHSVYVSTCVPKKLALHALLHDAAEAYMGDVPSPIKKLCPDFSAIEEQFDTAVHASFGITKLKGKDLEELRYWDKQSCVDEQLGYLEYLDPTDSYKLFMKRYKELTK